MLQHDEFIEHKKPAETPADSDQPLDSTENSEGFKDVNQEQTASGVMSSEVYWSYFLAGGNLCLLVFLTTVFIAGQVAVSGIDYWVSYWTNQETLIATSQFDESTVNVMNYRNSTERDRQETGSQWFDENGLLRPNLAIYIYTVCVIGCMSLIFLRGMLFMKICMNASRNIHNSMFANLLRATMRFFNTNPSGRILNRFSKDVGTMDELLPQVLLESLQIFSGMFGILTTVVIVNNWMIIPAVVTVGIFYLVIVYFLKTAQDLKRLEGNTKSPVFTHVNSTLEGLTTIRSRGPLLEGLLRREFDTHQDTHTGAWYLTIATSVAFGLVLDTISCFFIACVCFSFILTDDGNTLPGFAGLAISQSLMLTGMVQYGIRQSTEVISQMTSVEKVLQYTDLPKEGPFTTESPPPPSWPTKGGLVVKNVTMRYADNKPPVLKEFGHPHLLLKNRDGYLSEMVRQTGNAMAENLAEIAESAYQLSTATAVNNETTYR